VNSANGNGQRRVVITGLGMVTPLGNDVETSWRRLIAGESGVGEITLFDHEEYPVHFAGELKDFDPAVWIDRKAARRMDRFAQMVLAAARQAEADSGIDVSVEPERVGASIATGIGGLRSFQDCYDVLKERGPDRVNPFSIPCIIPNMGAGWVSIELGTKGPLMSECTACAASNMAIGDALDEIRMGRADAMFAGGTEAPITKVGIAGFDAMRALSRRNDDPAAASRPFDNARDGLVMGEAAGVLVLEELEYATRRGAKIYAELIGYGMSADASHMTEPDPTGASPARVVLAERELQDARLRRVPERRRRRVRVDVPDLVDEGCDRAHVRRRRCDRRHLHDPRHPRPHRPADDQLRGAGPRVRPRLHPERGARGARSRSRRLELLRLRRSQRDHRLPAMAGIATSGV
jgi:3-oxoacyl-(acyl-carrier-protein) synthase